MTKSNKNKLNTTPLETYEQQALFYWARTQENIYPDLKLLYAIPNGGYRHKKTAGTLWAEGVKSGVSDIHLPVARGGYFGLYIELKRQKGSKTSIHQLEFMEAVTKEGYCAVVCKGFEQAQKVLLEYMKFDKTKIN